MNPYSQYICGNDGDPLEIRNDAVSGVYNPSPWFTEWATGGRSSAGVAVNGYSALTHCPLFQGVNIIAGDFGQTPVRLVRNDFDEQRQHPSWNLLRVSPNALQTPSVWKETMMQWALIWGNGVSWIRRVGSRPVELVPLRPDCLWHQMIAFEDQHICVYHYVSPYQKRVQLTLLPDDVVHFQGLTSDGVWGYPLWQIAKDTIGQGLAINKHGNATFANGAVPGGVLEAPAGTASNTIGKNPERRQELRDEWNKIHRGPDKAGSVAILWEGISYKAMSHTNIDAQWIDAKKMSVLDAASLLNLPPHKLGAMEDTANRASLEEQNADYVNRTLNRHYNRADEEFRKKLLTDKEWKSDTYQYLFDSAAFLKGDIISLSTIAQQCVVSTVMNPNEGRKLLGLPPRAGGEVYGSPNINPNPKTAADGKDSPDNGRPKNRLQNVQNSHRDLLYDRILHLLECETTRLRHAAKSAKNFVEWLDEFYTWDYANHRSSKFGEMAYEIMNTSVRASQAAGIYCEYAAPVGDYSLKRHSSLLEACSSVTKDELPLAVERLINNENQLVVQGLLATALGGNEWDSE